MICLAEENKPPLLVELLRYIPKAKELTPFESSLLTSTTIEELELLLLQEPQQTIPCKEFIENQVYAREIFIPKHTFAIGFAHTESFLQVVSKGKLLMFSEGGHCDLVTAPFTGTGLPGYRKVGYALEDSVWTTFHPCRKGESCKEVFCHSIVESETFKAFKASNDRKAFQEFLTTCKLSETQVQKETLRKEDRQDILLRTVKLQPSPIHGIGVFATQTFQPQDIVGPANIHRKRTQLGRYVNHGAHPNCHYEMDQGSVLLVADIEIIAGMELIVDYSKSLVIQEKLCQV